MVAIGDGLGVLVTSQKRQLELGVRKSVDLFQLVKNYHQRWSGLKGRIQTRHADIEASMVKYDPANIGVTGESCEGVMCRSCDLCVCFSAASWMDSKED